MRMAARRVTAHDIAQAGSIGNLINEAIDCIKVGNMEVKEYGVQTLRSLVDQQAMAANSAETRKNERENPQDDEPDFELAVPSDNISLIAQAHGIKPLVGLLTVGSSVAQRDAAGCLASIAHGRRDHQDRIIKAGGIKPLASMLRTGDAGTQEQAAAAIASVSQNAVTSQKALMDAGAVGPLVALLKPNVRHEAQVKAAQSLANLAAGNRPGQIAIAKLHAIPLLLDLLASGKAQEATAHALGRLAFENLENQREIVRLGGIAKLLPPLSGVNAEAQVQAAAAIAALAGGERIKSRQNAIAKAGGIRAVLALIHSRYRTVQCSGLHALAQLATNNQANQDAIAQLDGMPPLVAIVSSGSSPPETQTQAARALAELVKHNTTNQTTIADLGAISMLVSLLRSTNSSAVEAEVAGALWALAESHIANQGAIVSSGAGGVLVKLLGSRSDNAANMAGNALAALGLDNQDAQREIAMLLVGMLTTAARVSTQERAAAALWRLVRQNPFDQHSIAAAGGAQPLVRLLREGPPGGRSFALWSLSLCIDDSNRSVVVDAGGIKPLVEGLNSAEHSVREQAASALNKLACKQTVKTIAAAGAIAPMITLLDGTDSDWVRQHAAGALSAIAMFPSYRVAIERAGGISPLVALLNDPHAGSQSKKFAAAALGQLSIEPGASDEKSRADARSAEVADPGQERATSQRSDWQQPLEQDTTSVESAPRGNAHPASALSDATAVQSPSVQHEAPGQERLRSSSSNPTKPARRSPRRTLIAEEGAIVPLVSLLMKNGDAAQEEAAGALRALAEAADIRLAITESGGIGPLVALLGGSNPRARENAEGALVRLSMEMANRVLIIQQLVAMLHKDDVAAREQAAAAIANLANESTANCMSIVEAGGIAPLLALLDCESAKAKENSASAIAQLARGSRPNQNAITREGGIPMLVSVLTASSSNKGDASQSQLDAIVTKAIWMLAKKNFANQVALAEAGVITPLVSMLGNASPELQLAATGVIECLLQSKDLQAAVVRTGAIAPLCMLSRDGLPETQEQAAAALWSLATDNALADQRHTLANKTTIAKLGGIESLVKMFVTGGSEKSQRNAAGALSSIASKHAENRNIVARRMVSQLNGCKSPEVAGRTLAAVTRMCGRKVADERSWSSASELTADQTSNQLAIAKLGGVPAIISWLASSSELVQIEATHALLAIATNNYATQVLIAKAEGLQGLVLVIKRGCLEAQEHAALALWHLASSPENQQAIADAEGIEALVSMLGGGGLRAAELASVAVVRLAQGNPKVSMIVSESGGIRPLVTLLSAGSGAAQQAASALAELALAARNRDPITNAGGIEPLIKLLSSRTIGTPETCASASQPQTWPCAHSLTHHAHSSSGHAGPCLATLDLTCSVCGLSHRAARALTHVARRDGEGNKIEPLSVNSEVSGAGLRGAEERRAHIKHAGGVNRLIMMLDGSNLTRNADRPKASAAALWGKAKVVADETERQARSGVPSGHIDVGIKMGMQEQAAAALAEFADGDADLQDAIIDAGGVPKLLQLMHEGKSGSTVAQEHAARTLWHLSTSIDNQAVIIECGCIPELVSLVRGGSTAAQEVAAGALSNLARGSGQCESIQEQSQPSTILSNKAPRRRSIQIQDAVVVESLCVAQASSDAAEDESASAPPTAISSPRGGLAEITESNGIPTIVALLNDRNASPIAKENAAAALWHLALDSHSRDLIAHAGGIAPLVSLLNDGTHQAHRHASDALARLANQNRDHQAQIAKKMVTLLMANNTKVVQQRAAHALQMLAAENPGSSVVIVNAGAISPLVHLLSNAQDDCVRKAATDTLQALVAGTDAAVSDLVALLGTGSLRTQELATQLLLTVCAEPASRKAVSRSMALQKVLFQLSSTSIKVQELSTALLSCLSSESASNVATIASNGGIPKLVSLLHSSSAEAQASAAIVIGDLVEASAEYHTMVVREGGIMPLLTLLSNSSLAEGKAEAANTVDKLCRGSAETQAELVRAGVIEPLVSLLSDATERVQRRAATSLAGLVEGNRGNQDEVASTGGVHLLVQLLTNPQREAVQAQAATALAALACNNDSIQTAILEAGGVPLLVTMVAMAHSDAATVAAESALYHVSAQHSANQAAIAAFGGILFLITRLAASDSSDEVQKGAIEALNNLAAGKADNQATITTLVYKLLCEVGGGFRVVRAATAISQLARVGVSMQDALADVGAMAMLVTLLRSTLHCHAKLSSPEATHKPGSMPMPVKSLPIHVLAAISRYACTAHAPGTVWGMHLYLTPTAATPMNSGNVLSHLTLPPAPHWHSMAYDHPANQRALATAGTVRLLVETLHESADFVRCPPARTSDVDQSIVIMLAATGAVQCEAASALWSLAADEANKMLIADEDGIPLLVELLASEDQRTQEMAAGALHLMSRAPQVRMRISATNPISLLASVVDRGSVQGKQQAAWALAQLTLASAANASAIAHELVRILGGGKVTELECATQLAHDIMMDVDTRNALYAAGVIPHLTTQVEAGTESASDFALRALEHVANVSAEARGEVTHQLIGVRQRAGSEKRRAKAAAALEMNTDLDSVESQEAVGMAILLFRLHSRD